MHFSADKKFRRSTTVVSRQIASETLVVPIRGGVGDLDSIYSFNPVGSDVWALMESEKSVGEMVVWITDHYEVSPEQAEKDVEEFLSELLEAGLASESVAVAPRLDRNGGVHANC
jgi:hypothetical protein